MTTFETFTLPAHYFAAIRYGNFGGLTATDSNAIKMFLARCNAVSNGFRCIGLVGGETVTRDHAMTDVHGMTACFEFNFIRNFNA